MKYYLLLLLIIFSTQTGNISASDYWAKTDGPFGASISSIVVDDMLGDVYLSTNASGVFYRNAHSIKWVSLNDNLLKINSKVHTLFLNNNGILIALTDSLGILSKTKEQPWESINIGLGGHVSFKSILKIKESTLVVGSLGKAIFRSTNNGESWLNYNTGLLSNENVNSLCFVKSIVFAGTDRGIFKSGDEGKKWLKVNDEIGKVNQLYYDEIRNSLFALTKKGVFLSRDFGISWNWSNSGLEADTEVLSIERFGDTLFIGTLNDGLKYSLSDEIYWQSADDNINLDFVQYLKKFDNRLLIGTNRAFFEYDNDKLNRISDGISVLNINDFVEIGNTLYSATDNGVYKSTNFGASWEAFNKGLEVNAKINCIESSGAGSLIAGTERGIYYWDFDLERWYKYDIPDLNIGRINLLAVDSSGTIYAGTASKGVWKTSENRWLQMNGGNIENQEILSIIVVDSNYIYAGTKENGLYRKAPFDEWRKITTVGEGINSVSSLEYVATDRMILAGTNVGVFRSRDNGFIWAKTMGTLISQVNSLISFDQDTVFAGLKTVPGIYITLDYGDTWSSFYDQSGLSKFKIANFFQSKSGFIFAGTYAGGCFRSAGTAIDLKPEKPILNVIGNTEFCEGEFCVLDAGENYKNYLWSNGSESRFDTVWTKGNYWVKVKNDFGFEAISDTVTINVEAKPQKPSILYNGGVLFCPSNAARYVWYLNDEEIEGANQKAYKPLMSGWYKCEIFTELNCFNISDALRVELVDIEEIVFNDDIELYPNPTSGNISIKLPDSFINDIDGKGFDVTIYNLLGVSQLSINNFKLSNTNDKISLNLEMLTNGFYFINIRKSDTNYVLKILKN